MIFYQVSWKSIEWLIGYKGEGAKHRDMIIPPVLPYKLRKTDQELEYK